MATEGNKDKGCDVDATVLSGTRVEAIALPCVDTTPLLPGALDDDAIEKYEGAQNDFVDDCKNLMGDLRIASETPASLVLFYRAIRWPVDLMECYLQWMCKRPGCQGTLGIDIPEELVDNYPEWTKEIDIEQSLAMYRLGEKIAPGLNRDLRDKVMDDLCDDPVPLDNIEAIWPQIKALAERELAAVPSATENDRKTKRDDDDDDVNLPAAKKARGLDGDAE